MSCRVEELEKVVAARIAWGFTSPQLRGSKELERSENP